MNPIKIAITYGGKEINDKEKELQSRTKLPIVNRTQLSADFVDGFLYYSSQGLRIELVSKISQGPLSVSFNTLEKRARDSLFGQNLIKALGINKGRRPKILDATAGFGTDSFLIACTGSEVSLFERNTIVFELLQDGLVRYSLIGAKEKRIASRMRLYHMDFNDIELNKWTPDVVYLDPMFPSSSKSSLSKKPMYYMQKILSGKTDESCMFEMALKIAKKRVVVKRRANSPEISKRKVDFVYKGNSNRFDVYLI